MFTRLFAATLLAAVIPLAYAQTPTLPCNVVSDEFSGNRPITVNGESELTSDLVFTCTNGELTIASPPTIHLNIEMFLNTNLTSRLDNTHGLLDTVLLLDEPAAAAQAAGTNVFQGTLGANNLATWTNIPLPGGKHTYRITNIRANAHMIDVVGSHVLATVNVNGSDGLNFTGSNVPLAFLATPMEFLASPILSSGAAGSGLNLEFAEQYVSAFKKRIENTSGPFTFQYQDVPGLNYCTESGFTPKYQALPIPGEIGLADTSTRLLATLSNLPPSVFVLIVPFEVTSNLGSLVAHLVIPPYGPNHEFGTVSTFTGTSMVAVNPLTHTAEVVYELAAAAPYAGVTGCGVTHIFTIPVIPFFQASLASAKVTGVLAPDDPTSSLAVASGTAPEPRFVH
jgi:hypothetical protein